MKKICMLVAVLLSLAAFACAEMNDEILNSNGFMYTLLEDGSVKIVGYSGDEDECLTIPAQLDGRHVTTIGGNSSLTIQPREIVVSEGIKVIEDHAFLGFFFTEKITLPDSITFIGNESFWQCQALTDIVVSPDHPYLATIDGVLFSKPDKRLIFYPSSFSSNQYAIPDGVHVIGQGAFSACDSLTSIIIPDSVTSIESYAFESCTALLEITIPESVSFLGDGVFWGTHLRDIKISPDHPYLATIDGVLFSKPDKRLIFYPSSLLADQYTIPKGIQAISDGAFYGCESLNTITIPDSVTRIGNYSFSDCSSLAQIVLPDGITAIKDYMFNGCSALAEISIPDSVTSIGNFAFGYCTSLDQITLPVNVEFIGEYAFEGCDNLTLMLPRNSYAAAYAKDQGISYTYPDSNDWLNS